MPGNSFQGVAEFNWWFDPEATQVVLRANIPHIVVPLDCTNKVPLTQSVYDQIANSPRPTFVTKLYAETFASAIGSSIFDTVALGVLVHPEYATDTRELYVDMNTTFESGSNEHDYGKSIVYADGSLKYASALMLQKSKVVFAINNAAYYDFYVKLMTGPVPVRFHCAPHDFDDD